MSTAALSNSTAVYNGPLFLALDYFSHESDDVAIGGTEVHAIWLLPPPPPTQTLVSAWQHGVCAHMYVHTGEATT